MVSDTAGLAENFILVYVEIDDFETLWKKYREYLVKVDYPFKLQEVTLEKSGFNDIKCARTSHLRQGEPTALYHLFINMPTTKRSEEKSGKESA